MKSLLLALLLCGLTTAQTMPPHVVKLKISAERKHMYWKVFCTADDDPGKAYLARASYTDNPLEYIEDGGKDWWAVFGPTQDAAAQRLLEVLGSSVYAIPAIHKPQERAKKLKRQCAHPYEGGPK